MCAQHSLQIGWAILPYNNNHDTPGYFCNNDIHEYFIKYIIHIIVVQGRFNHDQATSTLSVSLFNGTNVEGRKYINISQDRKY